MYDAETGAPIRGNHTTKADEIHFETASRAALKPPPKPPTDYERVCGHRTSTQDLADFHSSVREGISLDLAVANDMWRRIRGKLLS